jgi:hypothetical protein
VIRALGEENSGLAGGVSAANDNDVLSLAYLRLDECGAIINARSRAQEIFC